MTWELAKDITLDALKDSALVFLFVFIFHLILSFIDYKFANFLVKRKKSAPMFGSMFGLIPQCGTSVLGADLYLKKYITIGTLTAIFLSCSDEGIIVLLSSMDGSKMIMILPLIALKFSIGFLVGMIVDIIYNKQKIEQVDEVKEEKECHVHHHENDSFHKHFIHPLIHSIEIFVYVLIINLILGFTIGLIGEEKFASFMTSNRYLTPLFSSIIGVIPNCSSSLLITELFVDNNLSFGAMLAGLLMNSGLGTMVLFRHFKECKNVLYILLICFSVSLIAGYTVCLLFGF